MISTKCLAIWLVFVVLLFASCGPSLEESPVTSPRTNVPMCKGIVSELTGLKAAYAFRLVNCNYNGFIFRARKESDNSECDVRHNENFVVAPNSECILVSDGSTATLENFIGNDTIAVSKFYDQSGNSFDLIEGDPDRDIYFSINAIGNKPALEMHGNGASAQGGYLYREDTLGLFGNSAFSIVTLLKADNSYGRFAQIGARTTDCTNTVIGLGVDGSYRYNGGFKKFNDDLVGSYSIATFYRNAGDTYGDGEFFKNGQQVTVNSFGNETLIPNIPDEFFSIGAGCTSSSMTQDMQGEMGEFYLFDYVLTNEQRSTVEKYINDYFGLNLL